MTHPQGDDLDETAGWIIALLAATVGASVLFLSLPVLDLWAARLFANPDGNGFPLARAAVPLFFNEVIDTLAIVSALACLGGLAWTGFGGARRTVFGLGARAFAFLTASLALGPGIVVNLILKSEWGRARPRDIADFGGTQTFSPPLLIADQCERNCSFVSGDAALGFCMLALALVLPAPRRAFIVAAIGFGVFISLIRMVQGAHFLSDVIFAGLFVCLIILALKLLILEWGRPVGAVMARRIIRLREEATLAWHMVRPVAGEALTRLFRPMGLAPGGDLQQSRQAAFSRLKTQGRGRLWLFFRSRPDHFGL
ncbi:MAG: phosphatase PAP2 family protein [Alphaproteobacteria bacterium]